jgi:FtsP/CotA-like multicopper oxidase with cupredoxin domain
MIANKHMMMMDHPIHLHGNNFQVAKRAKGGPDWMLPSIPLRRDTVMAKSLVTLKIRFRGDN